MFIGDQILDATSLLNTDAYNYDLRAGPGPRPQMPEYSLEHTAVLYTVHLNTAVHEPYCIHVDMNTCTCTGYIRGWSSVAR